MTMLDIFKKTIREISVKPDIVSTKEYNGKWNLTVQLGDDKTTVELRKTCAPGQEKIYCWYTLATAMSAIYIGRGDVQKAGLWLDAMHDRNLIATETA